MNKEQAQIAIGGMVHDLGKILYRYNDNKSHSVSGYDFLTEQGVEDQAILDQVLYHHSGPLKDAAIPEDSPAYIAYWADNVSTGADEKAKSQGRNEAPGAAENQGRNQDRHEDTPAKEFTKFAPLESIFNILNGNNQSYVYDMAEVCDNGEPNYPKEKDAGYDEVLYGKILAHLKESLKAIEPDEKYVNSLLGVLEANLSFVPSSADSGQLADISLFDHLKITAAVGSCIYEYLQDAGVHNYKEALYTGAAEYYDKKAFLMFSMDMSGIQDFIYKVDSKDALKTLRTKSFYLEILLEHLVDELLEKAGVSRANLIYSGGGHAYVLLPNTGPCKEAVAEFERCTKQWFLKHFQTDLYVACGFVECSAKDLMNRPEGSYSNVFISLSRELSQKKLQRYSPEDIIELNTRKPGNSERECRVCGRVDNLTGDICQMCQSFINTSASILSESFITILAEKPSGNSIALPFGCYMVLESEAQLKRRLGEAAGYKRAYSKNKMYTGYNVATKLWVGDYNNGNSFEDLAKSAKGIKRLGVLRADVDNLGEAFVRGFERPGKDSRYVSLSRSATFSRKLSMFFKLHINSILAHGDYSIEGAAAARKRKITIVYSGGDDLFLAGAWDDTVNAAVDINNALERFTQGTLKISGGVGIYPSKYPVPSMARQTGELEEYAKKAAEKDSIVLFDESGRYDWKTFSEKVIDEKFRLIDRYFSKMPEKGASLLYKLMSYVRNREDKINVARFAYIMGRLEPEKGASDETKALYSVFSKQMYDWIKKGGEDTRQLITALYLYIYLNRKDEEK